MTSRLFTTYYGERNQLRRFELDLCLAANAQAFDCVCLLPEGVHGPFDSRMSVRTQLARQTYDDLLDWSRDVSEPDDISVLANCDLIIPRKAIEQLAANIGPDDLFCLSRYEAQAGGTLKLYDCEASQDVWAFRGKPKAGLRHGDFFGVPGCENRFAHAARNAGYVVSNPSRDITTIHVHATRIRSATNSVRNRLQPPYLFVKPHYMGETPRYREVTEIGQLRAEMIRSGEIKRLQEASK